MWVGFEELKSYAFKGYNYIKFPFNIESIIDENGKDLISNFYGDMFFLPIGIKLLIVNDHYIYGGEECAGNVCYDISNNRKHAERW